MIVSLIVAASENNVIGRDNDLPWHLPADMQFFREKTKGHPIILGRKNYESIGRPLPGRRNIVVSRDANLEIEGCEVVGSVEEAIVLASKGKVGEVGQVCQVGEVFVIGGGQIYEHAMQFADTIYLTRIHEEVEGDVLFPEIDTAEWELVSQEEHEADEQHAYAFTFERYERKKEE